MNTMNTNNKRRGRRPIPKQDLRQGRCVTMAPAMWDSLDLLMISTGATSRGRAIEELINMAEEEECA